MVGIVERLRKKHPKFNVPNFGAKSRKRVPKRWRKQRGIDSKKRIKRIFMGAEPTIGWKNPDSIIGRRKDGDRSRIVHNLPEAEALVNGKMLGDNDSLTIAGVVGKKKRLEIVAFAEKHGVRVRNR